ncbi:MAG: hypothetical protein JWQ36_153 [Enterovirga sp.]|nr:hypothetical protein [Enterovirga sp.]
MPEPRSKAPSPRPQRAPAKAARRFAWREWLAPIKPDLSARGIARLSGRLTVVVVMVTIMTALADWSARGFLDRGGLDRLVSMKPPVQPESRTALKPDRALDRGRLKAILAADKPR